MHCCVLTSCSGMMASRCKIWLKHSLFSMTMHQARLIRDISQDVVNHPRGLSKSNETMHDTFYVLTKFTIVAKISLMTITAVIIDQIPARTMLSTGTVSAVIDI